MSKMAIKPVSIVAFVLSLVALVLMLVGFGVPRWYGLLAYGGSVQHWYGLWAQQRCSTAGCSDVSSFTRIEGGKEFFFICKVFETLAVLLVVSGFILHVVYAFIRNAIIRMSAIYLLCGSGMFGLLATLIVAGQHGKLREHANQDVQLGVSFVVALVGALLCLVASAFTAWASYNKANFDDDDFDDQKNITHEMQPGEMDDAGMMSG